MKGLNLKNHYSLSSSHEVSQICSAPLKTIGVTYFNYIKIYNNGSRDLLTNNADWIEHFYENGLYKSAGAIDIEHLLPKGYFLWSELKNNDPAYSLGREAFNIDNGISFVIKKKNETILYIFASTRENYSINNFYMRNIDLFQRFITYFHDKGSNLIKNASDNKIYLPEKQIIKKQRTIKQIYDNDKTRDEFFKMTDIDRYFLLNQEEKSLYLTKREAECVAYMAEGATAKQIAKTLDISFRTVESHIQQVKEKLNCPNKDMLIKSLIESNIIDILISAKRQHGNV